MAFIKGITPRTMHEQFGLYHGQWNHEMDRCWEDFDRGYSVTSRMINTKFGNVEHVAISRHLKNGENSITFNGEGDISWSEKMMIKDELFGEDRFAIEVFPKKKYLVDTSDVYHLWVFGKKYDMPFGIHPKEYTKAINRGDQKLTPEEFEILKELMEKEDLT